MARANFCEVTLSVDLNDLPAQPAGGQTADHGYDRVSEGKGSFPGVDEVEGLSAEGRESGESTEEAHSEKLAGDGTEAGIWEREDKADDRGAYYVHEKGAPGECARGARGEQRSEPMSHDPAQAAAECD